MLVRLYPLLSEWVQRKDFFVHLRNILLCIESGRHHIAIFTFPDNRR